MRVLPTLIFTLCTSSCLLVPMPALAWGAEGHEVVALIAQHYLRPAARARVSRILATDNSRLVEHDMASEAVWADKWRAAGGDRDVHGYHRTATWHYVNLELKHPSLRWACWGHKRLPPGLPASQGPWQSCAVDKILQFEQELAAPTTSAEERLLALKFVLHLVGDLHQPLHASDNHDHGGNDLRVTGLGRRSTTLHHAWDTVLVRKLDSDPRGLAQQLVAGIRPVEVHRWQRGTPADWAWQAWRMAKDDAYGRLPPHARRGRIRLDASYIRQAEQDIRLQLSRAGVRLAGLLNESLGSTSTAGTR